jgi:hypothetical protein
MAKQQGPLYRLPGKKQLQGFLQANSKLFNYSELERMCGFSSGTLRHFCAGSRTMQDSEYETLKEKVLPKLCEVVLLLQWYPVKEQ